MLRKFGIEIVLIVIIMTGLLSGCTESKSKADIKQNPKGVCVVIVIEDCEYVLYQQKLGNGSPGGLTQAIVNSAPKEPSKKPDELIHMMCYLNSKNM